jgi:hypothetical protein
MKYLTIVGLAAALAAGSVPVLAQNAQSTPNPQMRQQFQQMRTQIREIHQSERAQILGALTPAHRSLLASIAGRLATSVNPDFDGAVRQIDSALSETEKQTIVNASQNARTKMRSFMSSMQQQFPMGPERMGPRRFGEERENAQRANRTPDAGRILLRTAMEPGPGMMGRPMHP